MAKTINVRADGQKIRSAAEQKGLSLRELGRLLDIEISALVRSLNNERRWREGEIERIANLLDMPPHDLIVEENFDPFSAENVKIQKVIASDGIISSNPTPIPVTRRDAAKIFRLTKKRAEKLNLAIFNEENGPLGFLKDRIVIFGNETDVHEAIGLCIVTYTDNARNALMIAGGHGKEYGPVLARVIVSSRTGSSTIALPGEDPIFARILTAAPVLAIF